LYEKSKVYAGKREDLIRKVVRRDEARQISRSDFWTLAKSKDYQILGAASQMGAAIKEHVETKSARHH
jgi:hypothetical protein